MTLSRRQLLKRLTMTGGGAAALALVGCGNDPPPAEQSAVQQSQPARPQAQSATQQDAAAERQSTEPQEQPQPQPESSQSQSRAQAQAQAQTTPAERSDAAARGETSEPPDRRLLVPDIDAEGYELEDPAFTPIAGARADFGEIDGAGYRIELPEQWNGELVLWAHGFRGLNEEGTGFSQRLTFDDIGVREVAIGQGYGWATSTYRVNGYVPGVGVDDLLRVKDRVGEIARPPRRTYIAGGSMGGATAQLMAQEFPDEIAAALAYCPAMGNIWVVDYTVAWHALAFWLIGSPPAEADATSIIEWARPLGEADEQGLRLTALGEQFAALIKDFTGGERWGFDAGFAQQWNIAFSLGATLWPDILESSTLEPGSIVTVGMRQPPADTTAHVYRADPSAGIDLERLNAEVIRAAADPVRRRDPGVGLSTGELRVPLLAMKTTGDLFTPMHLDRDYQRLVNDAGWGGNLVIQPIRRAGHCSFSESEALGGLTRLVTWLSLGLAPSGDDLQGDLSAVGTRFTNPFDADDPLRPSA